MRCQGGGNRNTGFLLCVVRAFVGLSQVRAGSQCIVQHAVICVYVLGGVEGLECGLPNPLPGQAAVGGLVPESLSGDFRPAPVVLFYSFIEASHSASNRSEDHHNVTSLFIGNYRYCFSNQLSLFSIGIGKGKPEFSARWTLGRCFE